MNIKEEKICRLCLNISENEYEVIDEYVKEMLNVLSIKMNWDVSKDPIMCLMCSEMVKRSYMFKSTCANTKVCEKSEAKFEIKNIYDHSEDADSGNIDSWTCQFCANWVERNDWVTLDAIMRDSKFADSLPMFLCEMDINDARDFTVCTVCKENLECYVNFTRMCLNTEEKINKYCQHEGTNSTGQVNLNRILCSFTEGSLKYFNKCPEIYVAKQETCKSEEIDIVHSEVCDQLTVSEELEIKDKISLFENLPRICHEGTITENGYKCTVCTFRTKYKGSLKRHMVNHENPSKVQIYSCAMCTYQTKYKMSLYNHMPKHSDSSELHKCTVCSYVTKHNSHFKRHLVSHILKVKMYKCPVCRFKTKHENSFKNHLVNHKYITDVETYNCPVCNFETQYKNTFNNHLVNHRDSSDDKVFKCVLCKFESGYEISFRNHFVIHTDHREVKMYKCTMCPYETKHKGCVRQHMLAHLDSQAVEVHKCTMCTFEANQIDALKMHMLSHNNASELETYKCKSCSYETKFKTDFESHMLIHTEASKVEIYKCDLCTYEGKTKRSLRRHSLMHKDILKESDKCTLDTYKTKHKNSMGGKMHNCKICGFNTKYRSSLLRHILAHNTSVLGSNETKTMDRDLTSHFVECSQVEKYQCSFCTYGTATERGLNSHVAKIHKVLEKQ